MISRVWIQLAVAVLLAVAGLSLSPVSGNAAIDVDHTLKLAREDWEGESNVVVGDQRRQLSSTAMLADMALPLVVPLVDLALRPVQRIILEWVVDPISYQIKKTYVEDSKQNVVEEVVDGNKSPDFWKSLGNSIQRIFLIEDTDESNTVNLTTSITVTKSNEGLKGSDTENMDGSHLKRVVLDRVGTNTVLESTKDLSVFAKALSRSLHKAVGFPSKLSVLKCGKISSKISTNSLDSHLVTGNEASLVMKLEGFTPLSAVILFGSQDLAGEHGLPVPTISNAFIKDALLSNLDDSRKGMASWHGNCDPIQLGLGGLTETIDMSLDTPHKIVMIVNHTNKVRLRLE